MLTIRPEQMRAFAKPIEESLECRLYAHVRRVWARRCGEIGEAAAREWIRDAVRRAGEYGIEVEFDVWRFVDLTFVFGPGFETRDDMPWARDTLRDPGRSASAKLDRLWRRAEERLRAPEGEPRERESESGAGSTRPR